MRDQICDANERAAGARLAGLLPLLFLLFATIGGCRSAESGGSSDEARRDERPPNIVYILADDLGYGEVGCYGQTKIRTPHLDRMAEEGIRFTQHYAGSPVCASSRCTLLTGLHTGHAYVRDNHEVGGWGPDEPEGQLPLPAGTLTIQSMLHEAGYATGCVGKWGLGGPGSSGHPNRQGFDFYYGYLCQRVAHNFYPTHLWKNEEKEMLGNEYFRAHQRLPEDADVNDPEVYAPYTGTVYSQDRLAEEALAFIRRHRDEPFFLYVPFTVPHAAIQVPEDSLAEYEGAFEETPYRGQKGYLPHPKPRAGYAAMVTRMDREIGRILDLLQELGLDDDTLVMFSSDNGPTYNGGTDSEFFESAGPFRGRKTYLYEGGIRVPMIARWPGHIEPGRVTDHVSAFWDVLPTCAEVAGVEVPGRTDGISFLPTLEGRAGQREHASLYWEFHGRKSQAVRLGKWKGIRTGLKKDPDAPVVLYDLEADIAESTDVAGDHPEVVARIEAVLRSREPAHLEKWDFEN